MMRTEWHSSVPWHRPRQLGASASCIAAAKNADHACHMARCCPGRQKPVVIVAIGIKTIHVCHVWGPWPPWPPFLGHTFYWCMPAPNDKSAHISTIAAWIFHPHLYALHLSVVLLKKHSAGPVGLVTTAQTSVAMGTRTTKVDAHSTRGFLLLG
jgi:hypothetical protein